MNKITNYKRAKGSKTLNFFVEVRQTEGFPPHYQAILINGCREHIEVGRAVDSPKEATLEFEACLEDLLAAIKERREAGVIVKPQSPVWREFRKATRKPREGSL